MEEKKYQHDDADVNAKGSVSTRSSEQEPLTLSSREDEIWEENYEIISRFLYASILHLSGLWIKTAQYMSSRADFVPKSYVRELSKLQDEAPETSWSTIQQILQKNQIYSHFSHVEPRPIASASIGQVHIGTLSPSVTSSLPSLQQNDTHNNSKVVIKIQHPHVQTLLVDDFRSLIWIAKVFAWLEPEYKFICNLMNEWSIEAKKEVDFVSEYDNLLSARASVDQMVQTAVTTKEVVDTSSSSEAASPPVFLTNTYENCPNPIPFQVEIPHPIQELSSKEILVMSFCEGGRIDDMSMIHQCNCPKEAIMDAVAQAFAHMMYTTDIFNGDPHPGNILLRPGITTHSTNDNDKNTATTGFTITLLDWGLAKRLPEQKRRGLSELSYAASTFDYGMMMDSFKTIGLKLKREDVAEDMEGIRFLLRDMVASDQARKRIKAKIKTDMKRMEGRVKGERIPVDSEAYPGEFFFFVRVNELLQGLGSKLNVKMSYINIIAPFALKGIQTSKEMQEIDDSPVNPDPISKDAIGDLGLNNKIENLVEKMEANGDLGTGGIQVCVVDADGQIQAHVTRGSTAALSNDKPMRSDTVLVGFSVTKGIIATLAHLMVSEGYLSYDEPVCERVWPEFCPSEECPDAVIKHAMSNNGDTESVAQGWKWKRSITLRHILTHQSALWSKVPYKLTIPKLSSCEFCIRGFEYNEDHPEHLILPISAPGTKCTYHYYSFGWLVAGCLRGAYSIHHGREDATLEEVYQKILIPKLSSCIIESGFYPFGNCHREKKHEMARTVVQTDLKLGRMIQEQREAKAMGELDDSNEDFTGDMDELKKRSPMDLSILVEFRNGIRGNEFVLDPRIWNSRDALDANVPAAGGRFSAKGLCYFYHELASGKILSKDVLDVATEASNTEQTLGVLQGQTSFNGNGSTQQLTQKTEFGLGYVLFKGASKNKNIIQSLFKNDDNEFVGHPGVGGSVGLFHKSTKTAIAVMLNGGKSGSSSQIIQEISEHFGW